MFNNNHIMLSPNYEIFIRNILSEYDSQTQYELDNNDFLKNIYIVFSSQSKPDCIDSLIRFHDDYIVSMSIKQIREIITKCYDATEFSDELLTCVVRYLPKKFFEGSIVDIPFKVDISTKNISFYPDNKNSIIIIDDLTNIDKYLKLRGDILYKYEWRKLIHLTLRLNAPRIILKSIEEVSGSSDCSKFLLKDNGVIKFSNTFDNSLNQHLSNINEQRKTDILSIYGMTGNESILSDDVMYKIFITKSLEDWDEIFDNIDFFKNSNIRKILSNYNEINKLF